MSDGAGRLFVFGFLTSHLCLVAFCVRDGLLEGIAQIVALYITVRITDHGRLKPGVFSAQLPISTALNTP